MYLYKFKKDELFTNTLVAHPSYTFYLYEQTTYINNRSEITGAFVENVPMVPVSDISLYEMNVDRPAGQLIYPFITKDGTQGSFRTISTTTFNQFAYGDTMTGSYPLSSSISVDYYADGLGRTRVSALKTALNYYQYISTQYAYSKSIPDGWDKGSQEIGLLSVPSIFYGSCLKKGTVNLRFFVSGNLTSELLDEARNGELIQVGPTGSVGSGSCAGVVLYDEGCVVLTGSWNLTDSHTEGYLGAGNVAPKWTYFGSNISGTVSTPSSSWYASYQGKNKIPTITMMATAPRNDLVHSNNSTYAASSSNTVSTASAGVFEENQQAAIKNIVSSSFPSYEEAFVKTTYISKIAIYDEQKKVIGVAKLANPVKKTANREFTFKLKLDI